MNHGVFTTLLNPITFCGEKSYDRRHLAFDRTSERCCQWRTQEFFSGGVQQIQLRTEDREDRDLGAVAPLVRGSGGSCNLVQEISFHIVKFS